LTKFKYCGNIDVDIYIKLDKYLKNKGEIQNEEIISISFVHAYGSKRVRRPFCQRRGGIDSGRDYRRSCRVQRLFRENK
jgi:hypothetical protein